MIDLKKVAREQRFRLGYEEGYSGHSDPWMMLLRGSRGHVSLYSETELLACTKTRVNGLRLIQALSRGIIHQDGNDGMNIRFSLDELPVVAKALSLYRRRVLSQEERARASARLATYRKNRHGEV